MELAQVDVASAVEPLDSPRLAGFVDLLGPLDELPAGRRPTFAEAHRRLDLLRRRGPTRAAFGFTGMFGVGA